MTNKTFTTERELVDGVSLPPHLAKLARKIEQNNKDGGFVDYSKVDKSKLNDFHPLHAMID